MFQVTVGTTWQQILPANPGRQMVTLSAPSTNGPTIWVQYDGSTVALSSGNGTPLAPGAALYSVPIGTGCDLPNAINAVVPSGSAVLCVQEFPPSK